jgi:hypothetical protein
LVTSSSIASNNYSRQKKISLAQRQEKRPRGSEAGLRTHLILVDNPTLSLLVISIVAVALLGNVVYGHVLQAGVLGDLFTVDCLAHARGACDYDIWSSPHDGEKNMRQCRIVIEESLLKRFSIL